MTDEQMLQDAIDTWERDILPTLQEYVAIPNVSEAYDADWAEHGHMDRAVELIRSWCAARPIDGLTVEVQEIPGRTPLIVMEVPPTDPSCTDTVLLYGHLDKQPEMDGWREGLGPWTPVIEGDRLYGRGGADDGYSAFASMLAIELAQRHGLPHARCLVLIEASEESGSPDLPFHLEMLGRAARQPRPGGLPRLGMHRLRPAVGHDLAARSGGRCAARRHPHRGSPLGGGERGRGVELPHRPPAARPDRGRRHRQRARARDARRDPH